MKERNIITKTTLHEMKVHIKKNGKVDIMDFSEKKRDFVRKRKLIERPSFLSVYETSMMFEEMRKIILQFSKQQ